MKKIISFLSLFLVTLNIFAQKEVAMADKMREDGSIWVVVAVVFVTFIGLAIYLFATDRKISKLEEKLKIK
jgi:CcmD family protein